MSRKLLVVSGVVILMAVLSISAVAQRWQNGGAMGQGFGAGMHACAAQLDLANKATLEGIVKSVNMGPGQGFPTFALSQADGKDVIVVASPFRALTDANFKISIGDRMSVSAFPSLQYKDAFVAAELNNLSNGTSIVLRDAAGLPIGTAGGMRGNCPYQAPVKN